MNGFFVQSHQKDVYFEHQIRDKTINIKTTDRFVHDKQTWIHFQESFVLCNGLSQYFQRKVLQDPNIVIFIDVQ